jgi:PiT family inorganic phosphate transporter
VVGAIAGFAWVSLGIQGVAWNMIGVISVTWVLTPVVSGAIAALLYAFLQFWIFNRPQPETQLQEWIPWLNTALVVTLGGFIFPAIAPTLQTSLHEALAWDLPNHTIALLLGFLLSSLLTLWLLASNPSSPPPHLPTSPDAPIRFYQIVSAACVAFAHGSNDVGNAIAPLAAILTTQATGIVPQTAVTIPFWILALGGAGIVAGLGIWGKKVIATVGGGIIALQPVSGFCVQIAAAMTVLLATQWGLPVSTSHAIVGSVVGIGLLKGLKEIRWQTLREIVLAWFVTIPVAIGLSVFWFSVFIHFPQGFNP